MGVTPGLGQILTGGGSPRLDRPPATATVVRSDATGVWVAVLGADIRHPTGPCWGARDHTGHQLAVGTVVLLVSTDQGPWVAAWDTPTA